MDRPRTKTGLFLPVDARSRFVQKCEFDPATGCVLWVGGKTHGHGNTAVYGSFWFEGRRWFAHRWAAVYIHDLPVGDLTVGHCCPHGPNTLCVEHLKPQTLGDNVAERNTRVAAKARQTDAEKRHWLLVSRGYEQPPEAERTSAELPFFTPPSWLTEGLPDDEKHQARTPITRSDDCPF